MYHSRVGKRETLLHDKDKYWQGWRTIQTREEEGEFTDQKPESDFRHSKFKGTNDHEKSPTEFSRREEHVSDTDKRFLNTDKDYKVKTNPTHLEGPVTEEKRGTKVRVEKEGSIGDKAFSKFNLGVSRGKTDLYITNWKHFKKQLLKTEMNTMKSILMGLKHPYLKKSLKRRKMHLKILLLIWTKIHNTQPH